MVNECDHYTYSVTWSEEDQEYAGLCLEFPSLSWLDETPGNALAGALKLVKNAVADMATSNEETLSRYQQGISAVNCGGSHHQKFVGCWRFR